MCLDYIKSSIGKKQIVAVTGLMLIFFLIGHLAGNLFIYAGPEAYNHYAKKLASLRPGLYLVESGLLIVFITHMLFTAFLVLENIKARPVRYNTFKPSEQRSLATRLMPYTGTVLLVFVIFHLLDFTFVDHEGPLSILNDGKSYGLFGVVYNAFTDIGHSAFYIVAMVCLGLHLTHGVESFIQTFGFNNPITAPIFKRVSHYFAILMVAIYSSIPINILFHYYRVF